MTTVDSNVTLGGQSVERKRRRRQLRRFDSSSSSSISAPSVVLADGGRRAAATDPPAPGTEHQADFPFARQVRQPIMVTNWHLPSATPQYCTSRVQPRYKTRQLTLWGHGRCIDSLNRPRTYCRSRLVSSFSKVERTWDQHQNIAPVQ